MHKRIDPAAPVAPAELADPERTTARLGPAPRPARNASAPLFSSVFMAGFECSSHRRADGKRLDLLASSRHAEFAEEDYRRLAEFGITAARDGLRWYLVEATPRHYDWSSFLPLLRAAHTTGTQVVWDICHYGWPDDIDIWSPAFVERFAKFARAAARLIKDETGAAPMVCPINEISFWAWAGGQLGHMNPGGYGRGAELKKQLVRAAIVAMEAIRGDHPDSRFLHAEPAIHVDGGLGSPEHRQAAEDYRLAQFEAFDMISGRLAPEIGGRPDYLDIVGVNYYPSNQWYLNGNVIPMGHHAYRPFSEILLEYSRRYGRPMIIAETGAEGSGRAAWLHYVIGEMRAALLAGAPLEAVCLYPILDCPGWVNERPCPVGLFSAPDEQGNRAVFLPLARELRVQQQQMERDILRVQAGQSS